MYRFSPPKKLKYVYIVSNVLLLASIIVCNVLYSGNIRIIGIPIALWTLFNGLWSINRNLYSWFHRNNKSYSSNGFWLICLVCGIVMSIMLIIVWSLP